MPKFNVIRVHHYHVIKVNSMRMSLDEQDIKTDESNGNDNRSYFLFKRWRRDIVKSLNNRKPLDSYRVEHLYHEDAIN